MNESNEEMAARVGGLRVTLRGTSPDCRTREQAYTFPGPRVKKMLVPDPSGWYKVTEIEIERLEPQAGGPDGDRASSPGLAPDDGGDVLAPDRDLDLVPVIPAGFPLLAPPQERATMGLPRTVPWAMLTPHERQAMANHGGQTLKMLASRGGLCVQEMYYVLLGREYPFRTPAILGTEAWAFIKAAVQTWEAEHGAHP